MLIRKKKLVEQMDKFMRIQGSNGNWNYDEYMHGMYNGMELMVATVENRLVNYKDAPEVWGKDKGKDKPAGEPVARSAEEWLESPLHDGLIANIVDTQMTREQKVEFGKKIGLSSEPVNEPVSSGKGEKEVKGFRLLIEEFEVFTKELEGKGFQAIHKKLEANGVNTKKELLIEIDGNYVFLSNPQEEPQVVEDVEVSTPSEEIKEQLRGPKGPRGMAVCVNEYCNKFYDAAHPYCPSCKKDRLTGVFLDFGQAIDAMKAGKKVKREAWGGYWTIEEWEKIDLETSLPLIVAYLKDGGGYAPAQPYQADILAEDWVIVE